MLFAKSTGALKGFHRGGAFILKAGGEGDGGHFRGCHGNEEMAYYAREVEISCTVSRGKG